MISINYPAASKNQVSSWQTRLDPLFVKYSSKQDDTLTEPVLTDGPKQAQGVKAIDAYIDDLTQLVAGWYEDRCDKYEAIEW